ncbi:PEPxxWA-CTERM sorting domain-containing protein [Sphingomonas sp. GB1N7]
MSISVPNNIDGVYINVITGATGTSSTTVPGYDLNPYNNGAGLTFFSAASPGGTVANGTTSGTSAALDLSAGFVIGATSTFVTGQAVGTAFQVGGSHIVGFKFVNEATGAVNYGYARITTATGTGTGLGFPATITQLVYENTGASLTVAAAGGAVPEPATWGMMILGFGMIGAAARKRSVKTTVKFA